MNSHKKLSDTGTPASNCNEVLVYNADGFPELGNVNDPAYWEKTIFSVAEESAKTCNTERLKKLFLHCRKYFQFIPKARTAKIVRILIDYASIIPHEESSSAVVICQEYIEWCKVEKRTYLRHRIQIRLIQLLLQQNELEEGIQQVKDLLNEVRKMDDKLLLVDIFLLSAKLYFKMNSIAKSRAEITACKNNANAVHCPPLVQATIDIVSGKIHCQEKDYETAYSYFLEALEAYNSNASHQLNLSQLATEASIYHARQIAKNSKSNNIVDNVKDIPTDGKIESALLCFKYLLLAKILSNDAAGVPDIINGKRGSMFADYIDVKVLAKVAKAYDARSLKDFDELRKKYGYIFETDPFLDFHLKELYTRLFEKNLLKVLEPFSAIDLKYIADTFQLPVQKIQYLLADMILEKKISGIIDQSSGTLILHEPDEDYTLHENVFQCVQNFQKALHVIQLKASII